MQALRTPEYWTQLRAISVLRMAEREKAKRNTPEAKAKRKAKRKAKYESAFKAYRADHPDPLKPKFSII